MTTIKPNPGALEPHEGMGYMDVAVGRFFFGEMPSRALNQAIIVLRGGSPFHSFEILMV